MVMKYDDFVSQHAVSLFVELLRSVRICEWLSEDKNRYNTWSRLCICTACMIVSLLTTCLNLNTPPLAQVAPFSMQDSRFKRKSTTGHKTQQARLPADSGL